jgi:hypothetical protein
MSRITAVLALGVLVLATGCGGGGSASQPPAPVTTAAAASSPTEVDGHMVLTAVLVVNGFKAANLPVRNERDNSKNCESQGLGCIELTTSDDLSIYTFYDRAAQEAMAASFGEDAYSSGNVVLQYAGARTPAAMRPKYEKVLDTLK